MADVDADDDSVVAAALVHERAVLSSRGKYSGSDIVFEVIKGITDIERRMHVRGHSIAPNHSPLANLFSRSMMSERDLRELGYKSREELVLEVHKQRLSEIAAGDPVDVVYGLKLEATPREVALMEAVTRVFKCGLVGKNQVRDWKILFDLAKGRTVREVGKRRAINKSRVSDVRTMQLAAIWARVRHLVPALPVIEGADGVLREAA